MTQTSKILFIEDDNSGLELGLFNLKKAGYSVDGASDGSTGLKMFNKNSYDLVVTDVKMPGISGLEVLDSIVKQSPETPVLVITAFADVEMAVDAMRAGAWDFIGKPFNRDYLLLTIEKALKSKDLNREVKKLRKIANGVERPIVGNSDTLIELLKFVDKIAESDATVLIEGQSGTGKELVARRLHCGSKRTTEPFVALNAGSIPSELIESELFGHVEGAFTGATHTRAGLFKQADGGTLFLDEIAEMPLVLQARLLRVLQEGTIQPVGSDEIIDVDVRIVAASNKDILKLVETGEFREDLYYRLNVIAVKMPSLKERIEDIEPLVEYFFKKYSNGKKITLSDDILSQLQNWRWPGNVRELENVCRRMVILTSGTVVNIDSLPDEIKNTNENNDNNSATNLDLSWPSLPPDGLSLIDLEKDVIKKTLILKKGNVSKAAVYLGIPRHQLAYRMQKYGISK